MNFMDGVLVRLADPTTRAQVFDSDSLAQIAAAAYDTSQATIEGPYRAVFDELQLGLAVPRIGTAEGHFGPLGMAERSGANFNIGGLGGDAFLINALWKGYVVATATRPTAHITRAEAGAINLTTIDAQIIADLGALPADRAVLAQERTTRFAAAIAAAAADPNVVTPALVQRALDAAGASDINEYFERYSRTTSFGPVQIQYSAAAAPPPSPKSLAISAAIVVRDSVAGLTQLLADCRMARDQLASVGEGRANDGDIPLRNAVIAIWVLPVAVFNDAGWPGADPAARRQAAGAWLAREGIGLAVVN
jgi:hypothetical protein